MIALTCGDYNSIALRLALMFAGEDEINDWIYIGSPELLQITADKFNFDVKIIVINHISEAIKRKKGEIYVYSPTKAGLFNPGFPTIHSGKYAYSCLESTIELYRSGLILGVVTLPICKTAMKSAGFKWPGHTEFYADRLNSDVFQMQFLSERWIIGLSTIHCSLKEAISLLNVQKILTDIRLLNNTLRKIFPQNKEIIVCGLNPHAGENGMFGDEEENIIIPAIDLAIKEGIEITGPVSPDTAFVKALKTNCKCVLSLYHDQGLIPFKLLNFEDGVNYTAGLPLIRTSVDHGTAYDMVNNKKINQKSLIEAFKFCRLLTQ